MRQAMDANWYDRCRWGPTSPTSYSPVSVPVQGGGSEEPKSLDVPVQGPVSSASGPVDDEPSVDTNDARRVKPRLSALFSLTYEIHDTVGDEVKVILPMVDHI